MDIVINDLCKSFGDKKVLQNVNVTLKDHGIYCLMGPSGMGKTTLLRILLGLEVKDSGTIEGINGRISTVFQEDRLLPFLTPVENISLVCKNFAGKDAIKKNLSRILPANCLDQPADELSGGMKRRVAIARAAWYPSNFMILDEPFTGLDVKTKDQVIDYLLEMRKERTMLISTHSPEDAQKLGAEVIHLEDINNV